MRQHSEKEHRYTSTGNKFWRHPDQMNAYRDGSGKTAITTHVSPEGACNLKCPYCSVTHRKVSNRLDLETIDTYLSQLVERGLKAVILTGGGEPTIYPHFDKLVELVVSKDLKIALITNGTQGRRVAPSTWQHFTWVRVSINLFDKWEDQIQLPVHIMNPKTVIGSSFVFTQRHENPEQIDIDLLKRVASVARKNDAKYIRLLPNCLLPQDKLLKSHESLANLLGEVGDDMFFHQHKVHEAPGCSKCHQSHFRPYLSEVPFRGTKKPGSVYGCDSVVLNNEVAQFIDKYQICLPEYVGDYLDGKIEQPFDPRKDCSGCVFTNTVNTLDAWKQYGTGKFIADPIVHEEFV